VGIKRKKEKQIKKEDLKVEMSSTPPRKTQGFFEEKPIATNPPNIQRERRHLVNKTRTRRPTVAPKVKVNEYGLPIPSKNLYNYMPSLNETAVLLNLRNPGGMSKPGQFPPHIQKGLEKMSNTWYKYDEDRNLLAKGLKTPPRQIRARNQRKSRKTRKNRK
jgi:hypothetical protein